VDFGVTEEPKHGVLGFGTAHLYAASRREAIFLLHAAWDAGVRWFDTAPLYGHGAAEGILGEALRGRREGAIIVSKVGIDPVKISLPYRLHALSARVTSGLPGVKRVISPPAPLSPRFHQFAPDAVRATVDRSLKALQCDALDLLLLHECAPAEAANPELLETLQALKRQGKIKAFGTAAGFEETAEIAARQSAAFDAFQYPFHLDGPPCSQTAAPWIAHSILGARIRQLEQLLSSDAAARDRAMALDVDPDRPDMARRLLSAAARMPNVSAVLFSTTRLDRVAPLAGGLEVSAAEASAGLEFARWGAAHTGR